MKWIEDLIINKTFIGLKFQISIIKSLANKVNEDYRVASPMEESKGIDGYIGDRPISIKPITYKQMGSLSEKIDIPIIFYEKVKTGLRIDATQFKQ